MNNVNSTTQTRDISVEEWRALIAEGFDLPIRIQLRGHSMHPLIRYQKDYVTIQAVSRPLRKGDIVLFQRADGQYVVHRIWKLNAQIISFGDNCSAPDAPIPPERVLGLVTYVHRKHHTIHVDTPIWRMLGRIWSALRPLRNIAHRLLGPVKRAAIRLLRR